MACSQIEGIAAAARSGQPASGAAVSYSLEAVSYSAEFPGDWREGFASLVDTVQSLLAKLKPTTMVRTTEDEQEIQTLIRYTGSAYSVSTRNLSSEAAWIHLGSLERTYALRSAVAGAFVAAASTMMMISASVVNPLTVLHALSTAKSLEEALRRLASAIEAAA